MSSIGSIALSGLNAASLQVQASAHNIANLQTPGFRRQQVQQSAQPEGGVRTALTRADGAGDALADDVVNQLEAAIVYRANLSVLKTNDKLLGSLLDAHA